MHIIHAVLLLALLGPAAWAYSKGNRLQYVVAWLLIFTALSWGYQTFAPEEGTRFDRMVDARQNYYDRNRNSSDNKSLENELGDRRPEPSRDAPADRGTRALQPDRSGENI